MSRWIAAAVFGSVMLAVGCGGGGGSSNNGGGGNGGGGGGGGATGNTVPIVVNAGPTNNALNTAFVSVTVCAPGGSNCQTIPNITVDTGSMGLRILKSAFNPPLSLPQENGPTGNPLVECAQFVSFFTWGPVMTADIKMAGEVASSAPIQVIGEADTGFPLNPNCAKTAPGNGDTLQGLQANGILGIGPFQQDCGDGCAPGTTNNPNFYYECPSPSACAPTVVAVNQQVPNPVIMFPNDNDGTILQLPSVPADGLPSVNGTLIFGIGTQSNNGLGNATVFTLAADGTFTTVFANNSYPESFIDSGSNGIFFLTATSPGVQGTGIVDCPPPPPPAPPPTSNFYCTTSHNPVNLMATNQGTNGSSNTVQFTVADLNSLPAPNFAFNDVAGDNAGPPPSFDWGLGFFFGRNVFTAIQGTNAPGATPPYFAY